MLNLVSLWLEGILVLVADRVNIVYGIIQGNGITWYNMEGSCPGGFCCQKLGKYFWAWSIHSLSNSVSILLSQLSSMSNHMRGTLCYLCLAGTLVLIPLSQNQTQITFCDCSFINNLELAIICITFLLDERLSSCLNKARHAFISQWCYSSFHSLLTVV